MIDAKDKLLIEKHLHQLTKRELRNLIGVLYLEWTFDDCSPSVERLMKAAEEELNRTNRDLRLWDCDRQALRWTEKTWENLVKPILVAEGVVPSEPLTDDP